MQLLLHGSNHCDSANWDRDHDCDLRSKKQLSCDSVATEQQVRNMAAAQGGSGDLSLQ